MTASWLGQLNVEAYVVDDASARDLTQGGPSRPERPEPAPVPTLSPQALAALLADPSNGVVLLDFAPSANFVKAHIPGAHWILRSRLTPAYEDFRNLPGARRYMLTCCTSALASYAAAEVAALTGKPVHVLEGGNAAWTRAGLPTEGGEATLASPRIDRYRRPYEGVDNAHEAMQAYLDWEYGLVAQLERDGTHGFFVI